MVASEVKSEIYRGYRWSPSCTPFSLEYLLGHDMCLCWLAPRSWWCICYLRKFDFSHLNDHFTSFTPPIPFWEVQFVVVALLHSLLIPSTSGTLPCSSCFTSHAHHPFTMHLRFLWLNKYACWLISLIIHEDLSDVPYDFHCTGSTKIWLLLSPEKEDGLEVSHQLTINIHLSYLMELNLEWPTVYRSRVSLLMCILFPWTQNEFPIHDTRERLKK